MLAFCTTFDIIKIIKKKKSSEMFRIVIPIEQYLEIQ